MMAVAEEQLWFSSGERDGVEIAIFPISIAKPVGKTENRLVPPKGKELHQIPDVYKRQRILCTMSIVHWHQMALKTPGSPKLEVLNLIRTFKVLA